MGVHYEQDALGRELAESSATDALPSNWLFEFSFSVALRRARILVSTFPDDRVIQFAEQMDQLEIRFSCQDPPRRADQHLCELVSWVDRKDRWRRDSMNTKCAAGQGISSFHFVNVCSCFLLGNFFENSLTALLIKLFEPIEATSRVTDCSATLRNAAQLLGKIQHANFVLNDLLFGRHLTFHVLRGHRVLTSLRSLPAPCAASTRSM